MSNNASTKELVRRRGLEVIVWSAVGCGETYCVPLHAGCRANDGVLILKQRVVSTQFSLVSSAHIPNMYWYSKTFEEGSQRF